MADTYKFPDPDVAFKMARRAILNNALRRKQKSLDLRDYGLERLPEEVGLLKELTVLKLDGNKLYALPDEIGSMTSLKSLSVANNQLYDLPPALGTLPVLEDLFLDNNLLDQLPDELALCTALKTLSLNDNRFESLPENAGDWLSLASLNLKDNRFRSIPLQITRIKSLRHLNLNNNDIREIPDHIANLDKLLTLQICENGLRDLAESFSKLKSLTRLYLAENQFREVPKAVLSLDKLEILDISRNEIEVLPADINSLGRLASLNVEQNRLTHFPETLFTIPSLGSLSCAGNNIADLPISFGGLRWLWYLDLSRNRLTEIPECIFNMIGLLSLQLDDNLIMEIPAGIANLTRLQSLTMDDNGLAVIPDEIRFLQRLQILSLKNNSISELPEGLGQLDRLWSLQLGSNVIRDIPTSLGALRFQPYMSTPSWGFDLMDNNLSPPLPSIVDMGQPASTWNILRYLRGQPLDQSILDQQRLDSTIIDGRPPEIPSQANGPHFELDENNVVTFAPAESIDAEGNNLGRLRRLHPTLMNIGLELSQALGRGNIPHGLLRDRIDAYRRIIDRDLEGIDFGQLYVEGVRLANATRAAFNDTELPTLRPEVRELADTLIQLHGTFILSTSEGIESVSLEERYRRTPREETEYKLAAQEFSDQLQNNPAIIDPSAARYVQEVTSEIGEGTNVERSGVAATGTIRNVTVTLTAAATLGAVTMAAVASGSPVLVLGATAGSLIGIEGLKKSKAFSTVAGLVTRGLDAVSEQDSSDVVRQLSLKLAPQLRFVRRIEPKLRRLAMEKEDLKWIVELMDWLNANDREQ